jgi:hypothetical protein
MKYGGVLLISLREQSEHVGITRLEFLCLGVYVDEWSDFYIAWSDYYEYSLINYLIKSEFRYFILQILICKTTNESVD